MKYPDLWKQIEACHPDDVGAALPFSKRLARENGWSEPFARRVLHEYQRFAYLSRLGNGVVTPSDEVDQAWHLHLTYTKHYWGPFQQALGGALHHMPTKGGADQAARFEKAYAQTLELYRSEFGEPPEDIWPCADVRFGRAPHFKRINCLDVWLVPKPRWPRLLVLAGQRLRSVPASAYGLGLACLTLLFGTGIALAHGSPAGATFLERLGNMVWHWATQHTLIFAAFVLLIGFVLYTFLAKGPRDKSSGCGSSCAGSGDGDSGSGCSGCGGGD